MTDVVQVAKEQGVVGELAAFTAAWAVVVKVALYRAVQTRRESGAYLIPDSFHALIVLSVSGLVGGIVAFAMGLPIFHGMAAGGNAAILAMATHDAIQRRESKG